MPSSSLIILTVLHFALASPFFPFFPSATPFPHPMSTIPNAPRAPAPTCFANTDGDYYEGQPAASPYSWCVCNAPGTTPGIFPTQPAGKCDYASYPQTQISIKLNERPPSPKEVWESRCRMDTVSADISGSSTTFSYCTCNDNSMHGGDYVRTGFYNVSSSVITYQTCAYAVSAYASPPISTPVSA